MALDLVDIPALLRIDLQLTEIRYEFILQLRLISRQVLADA